MGKYTQVARRMSPADCEADFAETVIDSDERAC